MQLLIIILITFRKFQLLIKSVHYKCILYRFKQMWVIISLYLINYVKITFLNAIFTLNFIKQYKNF